MNFCPVYARGLNSIDNYAIVGLSRPRRDEPSFHGLPLDEELRRRDAVPRCGLQVIDLASGEVVEWLRIEGGVVQELYDVVTLPSVARPKLLGFKTEEIERCVWYENEGAVQAWTANEHDRRPTC